jgi:hypothetical protein
MRSPAFLEAMRYGLAAAGEIYALQAKSLILLWGCARAPSTSKTSD